MSEVIRLLPDHIANQIAAGEVIQRPASVVKELVENAVDAGSTAVELHIKDAGKTLIQVIDNGKGMSEIDTRMSIERHATSKIQEASDLFNLSTKGFRGEALASIAAIAHLEIKSKQTGQDIGTALSVKGSSVINQEQCATKEGTCISVKNLFYNVPARRNFLKSEKAEFKHIVDEFVRIALTHGEVKMKLTHNDKVIYNLDAGNRRKRIVDLNGTKFNDRLVPIEEETDIVKISGFVCKPEFAKKTRGDQFFFVNNRYFKDTYFNHAVVAAFENLIASKTYPSYYLYLDINPQAIDVNVHPTKTEIKFEEDRAIYSILRSAVKLGLGKYNIAPTMDFEREMEFDLPSSYKNTEAQEPTITVNPNYNPFESTANSSSSSKSFSTPKVSATKYEKSAAMSKMGFGQITQSKANWDEFYDIEEEDTANTQQVVFDDAELTQNTVYTQIHGKYLVAQIKSGMMLINIKRAKERVIYDEIMTSFMINPIASQQMLFPLEQEMKVQEKLEWENNAISLKRLGFDFDFNGNDISIKGIPAQIQAEQVPGVIESITNKIVYQEVDKGELAHELISALANSGAMTNNTYLKQEEINHLTEQLFACEDHSYSPKGLKIIDTLSLDEITKRFL